MDWPISTGTTFKLFAMLVVLLFLGWIFYTTYSDFLENTDLEGRRARVADREVRRAILYREASRIAEEKKKALALLREEKWKAVSARFKKETTSMSPSISGSASSPATNCESQNQNDSIVSSISQVSLSPNTSSISPTIITTNEIKGQQIQECKSTLPSPSIAEEENKAEEEVIKPHAAVAIIPGPAPANPPKTCSQTMQNPSNFEKFWLKCLDFFSDEAVVPESDTDTENPADANKPFGLLNNEDLSLGTAAYARTYRRSRINLVYHDHTWDPAL